MAREAIYSGKEMTWDQIANWRDVTQNAIVGLHFRETIYELLLLERFDALRQRPTVLGELRPLEDGQRGSQPDSVRSVRVVEQRAERVEGEGGQISQVVVELCDVFLLGFAGSDFEAEAPSGTNDRLCRGARPLRERRR